MSDSILNYRCLSCNNEVIDFDPPSGACKGCSAIDSYEVCFGNVNTRLASEGIFYEYTLDSSHTYDERNDKFTNTYLQELEDNELGKIRSGKVNPDMEEVKSANTDDLID